jgi:hypothetical protein
LALSGAGAFTDAVADTVSPAVTPFSLTNVTLLDGPFREAQLRDRNYLLSLDTNALLWNFRVNVGLAAPGAPYAGWEAPASELRGHAVGHYLSGCAQMYASTGDPQFKARTDYLVSELAKCQAASPPRFNAGYLSAFPESFIDRVIARQPVWAPWYTLHKIMAGLLDTWQYTGNPQALQVLTNMAAWVQFRLDPLTTNQIQAMLGTEYGGMNEVLANLYAVTGNTNHLRIARDFDDLSLFVPLAQDQDILDGYHENTQIPKMIGAAREYEVTGLASYHEIARFFWQRVANDRSFVIGGQGDQEFFFPISDFPHHLSPQTCETCCAYNMLKLSRHVFQWSADPAVMDFYERVLYNHILASQEPQQGMMTYLVPLKPGHFKTYSNPTNAFWCCVGTGVENHSKYGEAIYFHETNSLWVNLFIASELSWPDQGLVVRQDTTFPQSDTSLLTFQGSNAVPLTLKIRYPSWAQAGMVLAVNGTPQTVTNSPGSYVRITRTWQNNDQVQIRFPLALRAESLPGDTNTVALLYGPLVLAGALGTNGMPASDFASGQLDYVGVVAPTALAPLIVGDVAALLSHTAPVAGQSLTFQTHGLGQPREVTLIPFYQTHHQRYSVYWNLYSSQHWLDFANSNAVYEARVADEVLIGTATSESAHQLQQSNSLTGTFNGLNWRDANEAKTTAGWFSYAMQVLPSQPMRLGCTYWGSDRGGRVFDIVVNGQVIATQTLTNNVPGQFFDTEYSIPTSLTAGRTNVTVRFQAHAGQMAGGVFGLRMLTSLDPGPLQGIAMTVLPTQPLGVGRQIATVVDNFQNLTNHSISASPWLVLTSSDLNVIAIGPNNEIRAVGPGTATVTACYLGCTASRTITVVRPQAALQHRYRFNSGDVVNGTNVLDSLSPADAARYAILRGNASVAGGRLILDGTAGTYVDLPPGIISNYDAVTIETWGSFGAQPVWSYLFGFGDTMESGAGARGFSLTPHSGDATCRLWVSDAAPGAADEFRIDGPGVLDNQGTKHIAAVLDLNFGYEALYLDGALAGERGDVPFTPTALSDTHSYIGRSLYDLDPYLVGGVSEFRIYQGRMSAADAAASFALGPDALPADVRLHIRLAGDNVVVSWLTNAAAFTLQSATELGRTATWSNVLPAPVVTNGTCQVTLEATDSNRFYRLRL